MGVTTPTPTALGDRKLFALLRQILDDEVFLGITDHSTGRHFDDLVLAIAATLVFPAAMHAAAGAPLLAMGQGNQTVDSLAGHNNDTSAIATIAAIRPAARNVPLAAKAHATITALAGDNLNFNAIQKQLNTPEGFLHPSRIVAAKFR